MEKPFCVDRNKRQINIIASSLYIDGKDKIFAVD